MSRAAVLDSLKNDVTLTNLVAANNILVNPNLDGRPGNISPGAFLIIKWQEQEVSPVFFEDTPRGPVILEVWAHYPAEKSTDYVRLDNILLRVKRALTQLEDFPGADAYTVCCISFSGNSKDLRDPAMNTISKYATFKVLSRPVS